MGRATLRTVTLGCKVNQYETQYVREALARAGFRDAADGEPADLCVVESPVADRPGMALGTSCRYAPVELPAQPDDFAKLVTATAIRIATERIEAVRV